MPLETLRSRQIVNSLQRNNFTPLLPNSRVAVNPQSLSCRKVLLGKGLESVSRAGRVNRCSKVAFNVSFNRFGFEGPGFWGLINPDWWLCHKGRRQSPVNLEPSRLLFDPNLQPLHVDKHRVGGVLANTGHSVVFAVDNDTRHPVNISGGPLSYRYQFHEIHLHFGLDDRTGSEHTVDGHAFPAEVSVLYSSHCNGSL